MNTSPPAAELAALTTDQLIHRVTSGALSAADHGAALAMLDDRGVDITRLPARPPDADGAPTDAWWKPGPAERRYQQLAKQGVLWALACFFWPMLAGEIATAAGAATSTPLGIAVFLALMLPLLVGAIRFHLLLLRARDRVPFTRSLIGGLGALVLILSLLFSVSHAWRYLRDAFVAM